MCVPDVVKNLNDKVFNVKNWWKRHIEWHEMCKCKCIFDGSVCNNKQRMKINAGANIKNWLIKVYVIKDLFGILVIVSANVVNDMILVSI